MLLKNMQRMRVQEVQHVHLAVADAVDQASPLLLVGRVAIFWTERAAGEAGSGKESIKKNLYPQFL